jgi:hypothetical protein
MKCERCDEVQEATEKSFCPLCGRRGPFSLFQFAPEKLIDEAVRAINQDYDFYLERGDRIGMTLCEERFFALMCVSEGWSA